jgi:hypothetical protein
MIYGCDIVVDSLKQLTTTFLDLESKDLKLVCVIKALWWHKKESQFDNFHYNTFLCAFLNISRKFCARNM